MIACSSVLLLDLIQLTASPSDRSSAEIVGSAVGMDICLLFVLLCRGLCDELITRPEKTYRLWCFVMCYLETS